MNDDRDSSGALEGVRILEFGTLLAGPLCARILGDFGAEVIKVEQPGTGDPLRRWSLDPYNGRDLLWTIYARSKKSVTLDLRSPDGQQIARDLAKHADILVENFRPGTMEKWGLGPDDLKTVNPSLIMVRVSGFGQTGPYKYKAGFGSVAEAIGGVRYVTGYPDRLPARVGVSLGDSLAALFAVIGALIALYARDHKSGPAKGQVVDVAIYEAVYALMESLIPEYVIQGKIRERTGTVLPHVAPSNTYPCKDGVSVVIAGNADNVFARLCDAIGRPDLIDDPRFSGHIARGQHQNEIDEIVAGWTKNHTSADIVRLMDESGVPAGAIYTAREMVSDDHFRERDMVVDVPIENDESFPMPGVVPRLEGTPGEVRWPGTLKPGEHNKEVYGGLLNMAEEDIDSLRANGII